jgi:tRNA-2-methylthio-N6-dimethylallyladenosine synthase
MTLTAAPASLAASDPTSEGAGRTYAIRTHGCQMNVHDSERLAGLLEQAGYARADGDLADVVVFNTCAVRENADNKLYGTLGLLRRDKKAHPDMQIAVGGCLAQKDRGEITRRAPWVDVVFGTHNIGSLPTLLERARVEEAAQVEIAESLERFPSTLPTRRDSAYAAWVSVSVGCNNTCTFCIVPSLRGREEDRRPGDILAEIEMLVAEGVQEVTLLGQNVNAYGVEFGDRGAFAKLLRACGQVEGLERVRFTSPHPRDFTPDVIAAMAETPNVMPQLHMPLQSGSDRVLRAMRRSYRSDRYLRIIDDVRAALPHAAITTDIIVGFPGETEEDFQATLDVAAASRFAAAFTFQYSIRPGTPAATMPDQVPRAVVQERYERLVAVVEDVAWAENRTQVGRTVEVMFADGEGRKDAATERMSGRARDNRLVHVRVPEDPAEQPRPGDLADVVVTYAAARAAPHARRGRVGGPAGGRGPDPAGGQPRAARGRRPGAAGSRDRLRLSRRAGTLLPCLMTGAGSGPARVAVTVCCARSSRGCRRRRPRRRPSPPG